MKLAALFFLSFTVCLRAAILTDAWSLNINDHTSVQRTYKQGESIDMRIILRNGLAPLDLTGATARFYWFTNTTANVWWTNSVTISAPKAGLVQSTWTPAMDTGAPMYYYWIGVWQAGSTSPLWRVTGNIRMLPSPGFTPNALPMPVRTLDFSATAVTNAPWVTSADWASGSNALSSAINDLSTNTDARIESVRISTGSIASGMTNVMAQAESNRVAIAAIPPPSTDALRLVNSNATQWIDSTGGVWAVTQRIAENKLLLDFSDNASFFSGQCSAIDTVVDVPCINVPCGQILMSVGVNGWTMKNLFNTSSQIAGMFTIPVTFPKVVNFSGAHQGSLTFNEITEHLTNCVDAVVFNSALTGDAQRLINPTNSAEWIDGNGDRWRITQQAVTNDSLIAVYDSDYSAYGIQMLSREGVANKWIIREDTEQLYEAGDLNDEGIFYLSGWQTGMEFRWTLTASPTDMVTFPKTFSHPSNGHTGWVDQVVSYQAVTSKWAEVANKADLSALPVVPTNAVSGWLLYDAGSNVWLQVSVSNLSFTVWEVH